MKSNCVKALMGFIIACSCLTKTNAQTDADGIMMGKNLYCLGVMGATSSWQQYWEGTLLRSNENLGRVRTNMIGPMGSLGITKNLNLLFSLPYVSTKASAGQLKGFNGLQDLSVWAKYRALRLKKNKSSFSIFTIAGVGMPTTNYVKDYLPLSIGLGSKNLTLRGMLDYQYKNWFATASGSLVLRSNITIDRQVYYTTQMIYSNQVEIPNATQFNIRAGFRNKEIVAEAVYDQWTTQGGFDITKNNMPFPSNKMNQSRIGFNGKYEPAKWKGLSLTSAVFITTAGRNMGKSTAVQFGTFYILNVAKKDKQKN
jgi:hypothetical protein